MESQSEARPLVPLAIRRAPIMTNLFVPALTPKPNCSTLEPFACHAYVAETKTNTVLTALAPVALP